MILLYSVATRGPGLFGSLQQCKKANLITDSRSEADRGGPRRFRRTPSGGTLRNGIRHNLLEKEMASSNSVKAYYSKDGF
jgi:hypothetical protein